MNETEKNINPCPKCGSTNVGWSWDFEPTLTEARQYREWAIVCKDCGARSIAVTIYGHDKGKALADWNEGKTE